jgi:hypothetical protein
VKEAALSSEAAGRLCCHSLVLDLICAFNSWEEYHRCLLSEFWPVVATPHANEWMTVDEIRYHEKKIGRSTQKETISVLDKG